MTKMIDQSISSLSATARIAGQVNALIEVDRLLWRYHPELGWSESDITLDELREVVSRRIQELRESL